MPKFIRPIFEFFFGSKSTFNDGYKWACNSLINDGKTEEEIENAIDNNSSQFDLGARQFLRDIGRLEKSGDVINATSLDQVNSNGPR